MVAGKAAGRKGRSVPRVKVRVEFRASARAKIVFKARVRARARVKARVNRVVFCCPFLYRIHTAMVHGKLYVVCKGFVSLCVLV